MKTNKLPNKKHRFELWLTIAGWSLAVFVSLLYLAEIKAQSKTEPVLNKPTPVSGTVASDRVSTLLEDARSSLESRRPEEAINRITTLWSVCHSTQQTVPEESHQIFAEAVSAMSSKPRLHPLRPPLVRSPSWKDGPEPDRQIDKADNNKPKVVKKVRVKKANIELPGRDYPKASSKAKSTQSLNSRDPAYPSVKSRPDRQRYQSPAGYPAPPAPYQARERRGNNRLPVRLNRSGRPLPPSQSRTGSYRRNERPTSPLEGRDGGRPPGY